MNLNVVDNDIEQTIIIKYSRVPNMIIHLGLKCIMVPLLII